MNLTENKVVQLFLIFLSIGCAAYLTFFYWTAVDVILLISIPKTILFTLLTFLIAQVLLNQSSTERKWLDRLYFIGLVCMLVPVKLTTPENIEAMFWTVRLGVLSFFINPIIQLIKAKK